MNLLSDRIFQIITFFVAALGWTVVHTVDRLVDSPTLEYKYSKQAVEGEPNTWDVTYTITNLSPKTTFRQTTFVLRADPKSKDVQFIPDTDNGSQARVRVYAPSLVAPSSIEVNTDAARFVIKVLAPDHKFELIARYRGSGEVVLLGRPADDGTDSFALVRESFTTLLAKNELAVLWGCISLWVFGFLVYLILRRSWAGASDTSR
jgi:hypothetical protein